MREFRTHVEGRGRLKVFRSERSEAVRAGFGDAWRRRDYAVAPALRACASVVAVAQRLPEQVVQEDADLLMVYDNGLTEAQVRGTLRVRDDGKRGAAMSFVLDIPATDKNFG